ncbi:H-NS family nucleoid-associated regulatory protein [Ralstonia sp. 1138]|uniref:H-NS family nucleoid-associated regulatory protein n=1 Tax=Ralstonia sp. 1138 TaxID=3156423 RepID=UPI00339278FE
MKEGHPPEPGRDTAIAWILEQMQMYGLSVEDLQTHGCFDAPPPPPAPPAPIGPVYMSADGQHWDGSGDMPDWLQRAVNAGQSIEHFRVG